MKLRNKVLVGITLVWLVFLMITYAGSRFFLMNSFLELEHDRANRDLGRIEQAVDQINHTLFTFTSDWSHWNDLYDFMQGKNPSFVPNNLNMTAFMNSTINFISYWDLKGNLIVGSAVNTDKGELIAFPKGLEKYLYPGSLLLDRRDVKNDIKGFVSLPEGIMMVAAVAVTDGDIIQPPLGAMVTGRLISDKILQKIKDTTKLNVSLIPLKDNLNAKYSEAFKEALNDDNGHFSRPIDDETIEGYSLLKDINNKPIAMFHMESPRVIYQSGLRAIRYYLTSFVVLGVLFSMLLVGLLRMLIVKRLEKLDHEVADIGESNQLTRRVDESGSDELSSVSRQINHMLSIIQAAHEKLEHRVQERTQELQQTNEKLQQEIIERRSVENELIVHKEYLAKLAHFDSLTSLPNRVYFNEMLEKTLKSAMKSNIKLAILFIDLDRFKTINDALGHHIGDLVLKEVSTRIQSILREGDILARLGGDEFIILLNNIDSTKLTSSFAERVLQVFNKPIVIKNHEFYLTASIGICIFPDDGETLEDLQRNADMAMYKSKHSGGDVFQYFTKEMNFKASEHIQLESSLRKAIKNNEFVLHYQPKYDIRSGIIVGVEALVRWNHPEMGMISPAKFIPHAEEAGLILQIGEYVIREACRACKSWQEQGYVPVGVAVNLSPKQFRHQDIVKLVSDVITETGLQPEYLELEITESAVMDNVDMAAKKLNDIKNMGIKVSVDDFGTGYTSISYLKQFPVSILKIDQNFVKGIPNNPNDVAITVAVIALAHSLGMHVVAEGVESSEQMQWLANHECDYAQGYFLSRPLPEEKLLLELAKVDTGASQPAEIV